MSIARKRVSGKENSVKSNEENKPKKKKKNQNDNIENNPSGSSCEHDADGDFKLQGTLFCMYTINHF